MSDIFKPEVIQNAIQFWHRVNTEDQVKIKFTKKDGTIRFMTCTLNFNKIPKIDQPKNVNIPKILKLMQTSGIIHVYDLENKGWRSVPFKNVEYLETGDKTYKIQSVKDGIKDDNKRS